VFHLERQWSYALIALIVIAAGTWAFIQYGVPALAARIAMHLPTSLDDRLGRESLELLDGKLFKPSQLPMAQQQEIRNNFNRLIADLPDRQRYRLEFRTGGKTIGANAFALPSGIVVMTDELVAISENPNELTAVLAHEVGHVVNRHALRLVLQSSASALVMFGLLGDVSSMSSMVANMPVLLTQAKYSRSHESEADDYAFNWLEAHSIAPHYFADILARLEKQHGGDNGNAMSYFSSHPNTKERMRRAQQQ
jgi:Zn-dependent protease with chaperone function